MQEMQLKSLPADLQQAIDGIIGHYKSSAAGGIDLQGLSSLAIAAVASFLKMLEEQTGLNDPAKDALALEAVGKLFDQIAPLISIPGVPAFVENHIIIPATRKLFLAAAAGAIQALRAVFNRVENWTPPAPTTVAPPTPPAIPRFVPF